MKIESYAFGSIRIDGKSYSSDVVIYPDKISGWWREEGHFLQVVDVQPFLSLKPDVIVIGTGYHGAMEISPDVERLCDDHNIRFITRPTMEAWKIYNKLSQEQGTILVAAFHLTC